MIAEADRASLLIELLAQAGNALGPSAYMQVGPDRHYTNLFVLICGDTADARIILDGIRVSHPRDDTLTARQTSRNVIRRPPRVGHVMETTDLIMANAFAGIRYEAPTLPQPGPAAHKTPRRRAAAKHHPDHKSGDPTPPSGSSAAYCRGAA
jgi:hypothetical protein